MSTPDTTAQEQQEPGRLTRLPDKLTPSVGARAGKADDMAEILSGARA
jgi:hypothetical protein